MHNSAIAVRRLSWACVLALTAWAGSIGTRPIGQEPEDGTTVTRNLVYRDQDGRQPRLDLYLPRHEKRSAPSVRPAILLVHGGSWIGGSKSAYRHDPRRNATRLAEHGFVVVAIDYLSARPGRPSWPGALDDLREAVRWTRRHADKYRIDPERIAILGQSAGGHLAMMLGTEVAEPSTEDVSSKVHAVISFYGPADLESLALVRHSRRDPIFRLFDGSDSKDRAAIGRAASPASRVSRSTPPMLLFHGSDDRWVPAEQSHAMSRSLESAGVNYRIFIIEGARHGFETIVESPSRRDLLPEILAFLAGVWNASPD